MLIKKSNFNWKFVHQPLLALFGYEKKCLNMKKLRLKYDKGSYYWLVYEYLHK